MKERRTIVVRNPQSSRAKEIRPSVERLIDAGAIEFQTPSPKMEDNADALQSTLRPGDRVISATGDGTGTAIVNAVARSPQEGLSVGFLPGGNFNDMAHTFSSGVSQLDPLELIRRDAGTVDAFPLRLDVNGEYNRHALLYMTMGWSALAAELFDDPVFRKGLKNGRSKLLASLSKVAKMYFATRKNSALPYYSDGGGRLRRLERLTFCL